MLSRNELGPALADGDNFAFHRYNGVLICRVWRRPDLSMQAGAACAEQMERLFERYSSSPNPAPGLFDVSSAPSVMGPVTESHVSRLLAGFEKRRQRLAVLCGEDVLQRMQYGRLVAAHAPSVGTVHTQLEEAMAAVQSSRAQLRA
jgi:hypothetical protein